MKTKKIMIALMLLTTGTAWAEDFPKDSLKIVDIEEVVVIATPKENRKLRDLPVAATVLSQDNMRANQVNSVKNLTGIVPNLFIPDYGSKLTTSIYIRGIGSRINTPSVGLYVDNIPYIDKSAFDFNYADIERIDILRGPQGTLYGRPTFRPSRAFPRGDSLLIRPWRASCRMVVTTWYTSVSPSSSRKTVTLS